jgi:GNAT superfamily N-acetyltransferase
MEWVEAAIGKHHDRKAFECGDGDLNGYLTRFARQNHDSGGAKTFVACDPADPARILGFYTLSPASVDYARTPSIVRRKLARHEVPAFRLGRLAVDRSVQGAGLGGQLLVAAGARCILAAELVGGVALVIDAKSPRAASWYARFGALSLDDAPLTLMLPLATLAGAMTLGS